MENTETKLKVMYTFPCWRCIAFKKSGLFQVGEKRLPVFSPLFAGKKKRNKTLERNFFFEEEHKRGVICQVFFFFFFPFSFSRKKRGIFGLISSFPLRENSKWPLFYSPFFPVPVLEKIEIPYEIILNRFRHFSSFF